MRIRISISLLNLPKILLKPRVSKIWSQKSIFVYSLIVYIVSDCEFFQKFRGRAYIMTS